MASPPPSKVKAEPAESPKELQLSKTVDVEGKKVEPDGPRTYVKEEQIAEGDSKLPLPPSSPEPSTEVDQLPFAAPSPPPFLVPPPEGTESMAEQPGPARPHEYPLTPIATSPIATPAHAEAYAETAYAETVMFNLPLMEDPRVGEPLLENAFIASSADNPFICLWEAEQLLALRRGPRAYLRLRGFDVRLSRPQQGAARTDHIIVDDHPRP